MLWGVLCRAVQCRAILLSPSLCVPHTPWLAKRNNAGAIIAVHACRRLIAVKGATTTEYLERLEFVWAALPGAQGPLASSVEQWTCMLPGASFAVRKNAAGDQPQCLSKDGKTCVQSGDCLGLLRQCADSEGWAPATCAAADGANDPLHWCSRARGALALPFSQPVPIRIAFFNVQVCNSGRAVANQTRINNSLYDDPHSLKNYWIKTSFGRAGFNESTSAIFDLDLPCLFFPVTDCNVAAWAAYVQFFSGAALQGRSLSDFQIQVGRGAGRGPGPVTRELV